MNCRTQYVDFYALELLLWGFWIVRNSYLYYVELIKCPCLECNLLNLFKMFKRFDRRLRKTREVGQKLYTMSFLSLEDPMRESTKIYISISMLPEFVLQFMTNTFQQIRSKITSFLPAKT